MKGFYIKGTFKQRPKGCEGMSYVDKQEKSVPRRRKYQIEGYA